MERSFLKLILIIIMVSQIGSLKRVKRIIEGREATSYNHPHPWFVILKNDKKTDLKCGGTIIDKFWILTAAHCIDGQTSIFLEFGTDKMDHYDMSMTANEFFIHPKYNKQHNDVALVKLPTALSFSKTIFPIDLVSIEDRKENFEGSRAVIYGYGTTDDYRPSDFSSHLLYALVTVIDNKQCQTELNNNEAVIESTICAKGFDKTNASICRGDSGGPLTIIDSQGKVVQIGISSFVKEDDCMSGSPSGYARVTFFLDFILTRTGIGFDDEIESKTLSFTFIIFLISHAIFIYFTKQLLKHVQLRKFVKIILVVTYFFVLIIYFGVLFQVSKNQKLVYE